MSKVKIKHENLNKRKSERNENGIKTGKNCLKQKTTKSQPNKLNSKDRTMKNYNAKWREKRIKKI